MKNFELSISTDYCKHWTIWDALREIAQNILDREFEDVNNFQKFISYNSDNSTLIMGNRNSLLKKQSLLLGMTTKHSGKFIGKFGEGYKLAFLVLIRNGIKITVHTGKELWTPKLEYSKNFDSDVLNIFVSKIDFSNDLIFKMERVKPIVYSEFINNFLHISYPTNIICSKFGNVLLDNIYKNKLFVAGLFVGKINDKNCYNGFDMCPEEIALDRDRKTVDSYNLSWHTSKIFANLDTSYKNFILDLIKKDAIEIRYFNEHVNKFSSMYEDLCNLSDSEFLSKHGKLAVPVKNNDEAQFIKKRYNDKVPVLLNETIVKLIDSSSNFSKRTCNFSVPKRKEVTPYMLIKDFLKENKNTIFGTAKKTIIEKLLPISMDWKIR